MRKIAKIKEEIYDIVHAPRARYYWENKGKTLNHNIDYIHLVSHR
jgi:S-adenosylmethionine synthetase